MERSRPPHTTPKTPLPTQLFKTCGTRGEGHGWGDPDRRAGAAHRAVHPHLQQLMSSGDEGVKHTNVASTLRNDKKVTVDGTVREAILERNKLDIALYEYAHEKYLRDLKAMKEKLCLSW